MYFLRHLLSTFNNMSYVPFLTNLLALLSEFLCFRIYEKLDLTPDSSFACILKAECLGESFQKCESLVDSVLSRIHKIAHIKRSYQRLTVVKDITRKRENK